MTARGVHLALTDDDKDRLLACQNDQQRLEFIGEIEEHLWDAAPERLAETDKAWDAIHRALNNGTWLAGNYPASHVVLGGQRFIDDEDYYISLKTPQETGDIAVFLKTVTKDFLLQGYKQIDPKEYGPNFGDSDFEYVCQWFEQLRNFWIHSAAKKYHVIFTVAQ
jgi:hypothetical protein